MTVRTNLRAADQLRDVKITRRYLKHAHGSCLIEVGDTVVLCAANVSDGVASWLRGKGQGWVTAEYGMLPSSTHERKRRETGAGGPGGRTHEIQRLIGRSLRTVTDLGALGESTVAVDCDVIQADGGTRTAAITGAWIALNDAFGTWREAGRIATSPILDHIAATSVGLVDGELLLDLDYSEDSRAEVDMNVVIDSRGRFVEVQGTGERTPFDRERLDGMLSLATAGASALIDIQRKMLAEELLTYGR
jgi:ribonuclease PH